MRLAAAPHEKSSPRVQADRWSGGARGESQSHCRRRQPHRTRYWRTARLDPLFKQRAEKVLWCYGNAARLARQGIWTVAVDEKPNPKQQFRFSVALSELGVIEGKPLLETIHQLTALVEGIVTALTPLLE